MSSRLAARVLACLIWLRRAGAWVPLTQLPISLNRNPSLHSKNVPGQPCGTRFIKIHLNLILLISIILIKHLNMNEPTFRHYI